LLRRAWGTAHQIATLLYEQFCATQVAVFGSLTEPLWFTKASDIDIVVWGLSDDAYFDALGKTIGFSPEFKIDLIKFENSEMLFRERVQQQALLLKKGFKGENEIAGINPLIQRSRFREQIETCELYDMNKHRLIKRITDERARIVDIIKDIASELKQLEVAPDEYRLNVEITIGNYLYDVYKGTEVIFKQIARDIDGRFPKSAEWHKALLRQMTERHPERPPVISEETAEGLETLLKFRHLFTSIHARQLDYKRTAENASRLMLFSRVSLKS